MHIFTLASSTYKEVYASIGYYHIRINEDTPAIHVANLAYRNSIAYDDIVWSDTINPAMRNAVCTIMAPGTTIPKTYIVTLTHKIDTDRDIVAYVRAYNRPSAIELVTGLISHNHSVDMYDTDATLAPNAPNTNNP